MVICKLNHGISRLFRTQLRTVEHYTRSVLVRIERATKECIIVAQPKSFQCSTNASAAPRSVECSDWLLLVT